MNFTDLKAHWDHTLGYILGISFHNDFNETSEKNITIKIVFLIIKLLCRNSVIYLLLIY